MLYTFGKFEDPDGTIGWRVLPPLDRHCAKAYLTLSDGLEVTTEDPVLLDLLAEKAAKAARALRIADGMKECDTCHRLVARTWERTITVGRGIDDSALGDTEVVECCQVCAGLSDDDIDVDDSTINYRVAP